MIYYDRIITAIYAFSEPIHLLQITQILQPYGLIPKNRLGLTIIN